MAKRKRRGTKRSTTAPKATKQGAKRAKGAAKKPVPHTLPPDERQPLTGGPRLYGWIAIGIAAVLIIIIALALSGSDDGADPDGSDEPLSDVVSFDLYVMSQCPYGTQAVNALGPVMAALGDHVELDIDYIARVAGDGFSSLHGQSEVIGNMIQLCAMELAPESYLDFIICQNNGNVRDLTSSIDSCAEQTGIDAEAIKTCYAGERGAELLRESIAESQQVGASASPTMFINGEKYAGARDPDSLQRAICAKLSSNQACDAIPECARDADCTGEEGMIGICENPGADDARCVYEEPVEFSVIVLNAKDCADCDTAQLEATTSQLFKGAQIRHVEVTSDEGQMLISRGNIERVPAFIFDRAVLETYAVEQQPQLADAFIPSGPQLRLSDSVVEPTYFVDDEARAEHYEALGVTLDDNRPQIDFFVMSYCPYGNQAEEAIAPVYEALAGLADFNPRYVLYANYRGGGEQFCIDEQSKYCSMHGIGELNQNLRELCVLELDGEQAYFDFTLAMNDACTADNADECWTEVAEGLDLDTAAIESCFNDRALEMAAEQSRLNEVYGVTGSPTVFIDAQKYSGARTPEGYMSALCAAFDEPPAACDEMDVPEIQGQAVASGACG